MGLLVERNGPPQTIQNVTGCSRSPSDFIHFLPRVRKCHSRRLEGKTFFVAFRYMNMTNLLPSTAHQHAYFDAGILHSDISIGNTLITDEGKGLLIDWDLCLNLNNDRASARWPDRTVSVYIFAIDTFLTMSLGNVAVYVSRTAS